MTSQRIYKRVARNNLNFDSLNSSLWFYFHWILFQCFLATFWSQCREIKCRTKAKRVLKIDFWRKGRNVFCMNGAGKLNVSLCGKSMNGRKYQEIIISLRSVDNNYRRIVFTQWNLEILNQTTIKSSTCVATCPIFKSNRFLLEKISKVCYDYQE